MIFAFGSITGRSLLSYWHISCRFSSPYVFFCVILQSIASENLMKANKIKNKINRFIMEGVPKEATDSSKLNSGNQFFNLANPIGAKWALNLSYLKQK